ncbi:hypothetical protein CDN99_20145 [Roseateles aquatilis]|uniref:Uncharacterized protein n=1 Tax=Roseateles aquatilis TaxID=431061 RepID=A0A246J329_9BURK|nr:hypothetical protein CDN99_20145 [Roseateles aquatilis]
MIQAITATMALTASMYTPMVNAGVHCTEKIRSAILHENGEVYFETDNTCNGAWCQVAWGTSERKKNALAMLLSAKLAERPVTFYWPTLNACSEKNVVYASPGYMVLY